MCKKICCCHTYDGLAGRDMDAMLIGIYESVQEEHMKARIGQVFYLGDKMKEFGVPIVTPIDGHGVFVDAKQFLPHVYKMIFQHKL